jgi:hypothetical protein
MKADPSSKVRCNQTHSSVEFTDRISLVNVFMSAGVSNTFITSLKGLQPIRDFTSAQTLELHVTDTSIPCILCNDAITPLTICLA